MDRQNDRSQACWLPIPAALAPAAQLVVYCASNRAPRCTKAVASGFTWLIRPPRASRVIPPAPPAAPATDWRRCTPCSIAAIPALLSGLVKKSDLANCGSRANLPYRPWEGRRHSATVCPAQPAMTSITSR